MKDNTVVYVAAGGLALYLFLKSRQAATLPPGTVSVGPVTAQPIQQQQGLLLPFLQKVVQSLAPGTSSAAASAFPTYTSGDPGIIDTSGMTFTPIPNQPPSSADNSPILSATDTEGDIYFSNGGTFDPNANITTGDLYVPPFDAATSDPNLSMPTVDTTVYDDSDYGGE